MDSDDHALEHTGEDARDHDAHAPVDINIYYRGLAAQELQELGDRLLALSTEATNADAHEAAWKLSDVATQLLDMGLELGGQTTPG